MSKKTEDNSIEALLRWRLAIGPGAEKTSSEFNLENLGPGLDLEAERLSELDDAMSFVYQEKQGSSGPSAPYVPKWLGLLRDFFRHEVVAFVQKDAIERRGLTQLLFEPETLPFLEKNIDLVATLIGARNLIPDKAKQIARQVVREVVEELRKKLESETRTAILGAVRKNTESPLKLMRNIDWKKTIRKNLRGWDREKKQLIPEKIHFWANQRRRHEWDVVLVVDQSGSMATSVVYSSVMAAIFASIDVLKTKLVFFDTEIVDMSAHLSDPVEVLFSTQLGGGTDINRAVAYAQANLIDRPEKTLFILVTDLYEGGNQEELVMRMRQIVDGRSKTMVLLALSDGGKPSYDHQMAATLGGLGIPCFGCTPTLLVGVVERIMKNQDIGDFIAAAKKGTPQS